MEITTTTTTTTDMGWITPEAGGRFMVTPTRPDGTSSYMESELVGQTFANPADGVQYKITGAFTPLGFIHPHGKNCYIVAVVPA